MHASDGKPMQRSKAVNTGRSVLPVMINADQTCAAQKVPTEASNTESMTCSQNMKQILHSLGTSPEASLTEGVLTRKIRYGSIACMPKPC